MLDTRKNTSRPLLWLATPLLGLTLGATAACSREEVDHGVDRAEHDVDHAVQRVRDNLPPAAEVKAKLKHAHTKIQEEGHELLDDVRLVRDAHEQRKREREDAKAHE